MAITRINQESLVVIEKGKQSHGDDVMLIHTTKSQVRRGKHCLNEKCDGKLFPGKHWARHLDSHKKKNVDEEIEFSYCSGVKCDTCNQFEETKSPPTKKTAKGMKYFICSSCNKDQRQDQYLTMRKPIVCIPCINKKEGKKQGKKRQEKKRLYTETSLSSFSPSPNDSDIMEITEKDMIKVQGVPVLQENDMAAYRQEDESLLKHKTPTKRPALDNSSVSPIAINSTAMDTHTQIDTTISQGKAISSVSQEQSGFTSLSNALQSVSSSKEETVFLADTVQRVCHLFVCEYAEQCIQSNICTQLIDCINLLIDRVDILPQHKMVGLIAAAFIIGQSCWQSAMTALNCTSKENRDSLMQKLSVYIANNYDTYTAKWFEQYWKYSTDQQIDICKQFISSGQEVVPDILTLSLVVQKTNIRDFVLFTSEALANTKTGMYMILDHIRARPSQPLISFSDMRKLLSTLSSKRNQQAVQKQQEELKQAAIVQWMEILDAASTTVNVADAESIQDSLDELQRLHGALTELNQDITQSEDSLFGAILDSIEVKPNKKQFALAQYCVADLYANQRQLWVVPSGQGKARIAAAIAMISLLSGQSEKIYTVFPNEHLMKRDQAEFEPLIAVSSMGEDKVTYRVGLKDFKPELNALIIVDEIDVFLLDTPVEFKAVIAANACIGLTATPAGTQMEKQVAKALEFKERFYSFGASAAIASADKLLVDENITAATIADKVAYIQQIAKSNPVLVYCNEDITKALIDANVQPVLVKEDIDYERLRTLDQMVKEAGLYTVIVSQDTLGMRGIDYRCKMLKLTLVIAQSFDNKRDATQAFNRVGRFGDSYNRVKFADVEVLNKKKEMAQLIAHTKLVSLLAKPDVAKLQPVVVKKATTKYKGKNLPRQTKLLGQ